MITKLLDTNKEEYFVRIYRPVGVLWAFDLYHNSERVDKGSGYMTRFSARRAAKRAAKWHKAGTNREAKAKTYTVRI